MANDDDLAAENARLKAEIEKLERKLYGPVREPPPRKGKKQPQPRPVVVYLQPPSDWQRPEGSEGPGAKGMHAVTSTFARITADKHPEWDVRVIDSDDVQRIPVGATVTRGLGGGPQWLAVCEDEEIKLRRVPRGDDQQLWDRIGALLNGMTAHLHAAESAGASREGQGHLLSSRRLHRDLQPGLGPMARRRGRQAASSTRRPSSRRHARGLACRVNAPHAALAARG